MFKKLLIQSWKWWRRLSRTKQTTVFAVPAIVLLLTLSFISNSNKNRSNFISNDPITSKNIGVPLTLSSFAQQNGAFCLDGSLPGYHIHRGFGSGSNNWLLHLEGGGWCTSLESCSNRRISQLGSSKYMQQEVEFSGILSNNPLENPDFFNWNKVELRYCDGASFSGHPNSEKDNTTELFFRGQLIWEAIMEDLLLSGLNKSKQALLTGCSAGGLATLLHCDSFREILPKDAHVKCLSDGGFFLNEKDISQNPSIEDLYRKVVHLQGVASSLNKDCLSKMEPHKCFFPQEFINNIKTPIFLVNSAYDWWQIANIFITDTSDVKSTWIRCKLNIHKCDPEQLKVLQGFREKLLTTLSEFKKNKDSGMFINSCFIHCQTWKTDTWHSRVSPRINNKTIAESVGDWYFNREEAKHIDCDFPCNPTCYHQDLSHGLYI